VATSVDVRSQQQSAV